MSVVLLTSWTVVGFQRVLMFLTVNCLMVTPHSQKNLAERFRPGIWYKIILWLLNRYMPRRIFGTNASFRVPWCIQLRVLRSPLNCIFLLIRKPPVFRQALWGWLVDRKQLLQKIYSQDPTRLVRKTNIEDDWHSQSPQECREIFLSQFLSSFIQWQFTTEVSMLIALHSWDMQHGSRWHEVMF